MEGCALECEPERQGLPVVECCVAAEAGAAEVCHQLLELGGFGCEINMAFHAQSQGFGQETGNLDTTVPDSGAFGVEIIAGSGANLNCQFLIVIQAMSEVEGQRETAAIKADATGIEINIAQLQISVLLVETQPAVGDGEFVHRQAE